MWSPAETVLFAIGILIYGYWAYQMSIAMNGFRDQPAAPSAAPLIRFAVLIPAHNEERVIGPLLESLQGQTYPRELTTIYVSCDNCTDSTAQIAERHGARVLIREERGRSGKTENLRWALERIPLDDHDALVIFDADNLAREDFLERMNDYLVVHFDA